MGTNAASEPLKSFILVIYELWPTYSFPFCITVPLEMVALTTSRIYLMIYLISITDIDKIYRRTLITQH